MPLLRNTSRSSPDSIYPAGSASNIDITDVNAMGGSEHNGLLVGRAKKPDTISLAVHAPSLARLKFSWGALIFHSFSRRSSPFFSYSPQERDAASRQVRIRIRSSFLMKCLSGRAPFTPPFSPSWDIQVLEAALARARGLFHCRISCSPRRLRCQKGKGERKRGRGESGPYRSS